MSIESRPSMAERSVIGPDMICKNFLTPEGMYGKYFGQLLEDEQKVVDLHQRVEQLIVRLAQKDHVPEYQAYGQITEKLGLTPSTFGPEKADIEKLVAQLFPHGEPLDNRDYDLVPPQRELEEAKVAAQKLYAWFDQKVSHVEEDVEAIA